MSRLAIPALAMALTLALPALAATPINETRALSPTGEVEIENLKGRIEVRVWDRAEVKIEGSLGEGVERLAIEGGRDKLAVRVKYPRRSGMNGNNSEPTQLLLTVPRRASLDIDSVSADIDVQGTAADKLSADAVSGDVLVIGAPRKAEINTVSGDQQLTINTRDASVDTVSGDVALRGRFDGEVEFNSVSGNVTITNNRENPVRKLSGSSVSGDLTLSTSLASGGEIEVDTLSGDLRLSLPRNVSATVTGESFSGDLRVEGAQVQRPKHGPGSSVSHRYGTGDGRIAVESFSGSASVILE
ncbi:DUF4097 family beta strand repeat-containing protein [Aerolutibacter ruishenii]|uniref:DUF4097 and DUF4098 domain-containing protein YvlB n=1 Tax=Aerolutibacter ruishenii TaxID=686800 RepID=A0A562M3D3_9GAMM|nr:DUF4097 family beta strand repeat-containing protein [Lysobacter ruishenii]TWI14111.1 DUF4097 and DUF4098 domain-containing protein YvlB [Lysobacter ruishenii]